MIFKLTMSDVCLDQQKISENISEKIIFRFHLPFVEKIGFESRNLKKKWPLGKVEFFLKCYIELKKTIVFC